MAEDFAERHVARWRDHWIDIDFDDAVELATVRISRIKRHAKESTRRAAAEVGLQVYEYETLHALMIRDTPGTASPRELALAADVSPAGMTGRLDALEKAGLIKRTPSRTDRRSVTVEATSRGVDVWRRAMDLRGQAERRLFGALSPKELASLNRLLRKVALVADEEFPAEP
ncbi:MarR family transcriptional regulator [Kineosporia rhizophila]|uniref:MarR family winged helix-turn-helix transcriptional regulator n=1 Tax=Kineosporia TaxID=49184 RepID=UPI001E562DF7|nr:MULTISPECIES: MarR family transcriptional regulator [Kineosporia]MCE0534646.1 MarR family transcriptional regulator [Kineosporia rhizophila]GLY15563.1 MarR family transcriptional regulator [Kineosporia sp. NBRC 101677]